jgi:hypothetical protein
MIVRRWAVLVLLCVLLGGVVVADNSGPTVKEVLYRLQKKTGSAILHFSLTFVFAASL